MIWVQEVSEIWTSMDFRHSIAVQFPNSLDFRHISKIRGLGVTNQIVFNSKLDVLLMANLDSDDKIRHQLMDDYNV